MSKPKKKPADHDHPWKLIFTYFFQEGILFIQPALHDLIDWKRGVEFLEQELHEAIKTRFRSAKICDKLAKVWLKNGKKCILLVHVEIESAPRANFGKRFFWYRILIFDKHKTENIYSLAVYTGKRSKNQVSKYEFRFLDNKISFDFPALKIWEMAEEELEASDNIFALFVLAQKYANRSKDNMEQRLTFRKHLFKLATKKKISRQRIFRCLIFVKYLTAMPKGMEIKYQTFQNKIINHKSMDLQLAFERDLKELNDLYFEGLKRGFMQRKLKEEKEKVAKEVAAKAAKAAKEAAVKAAEEAKAAKEAAVKAAKETAKEAAKEAAKKACTRVILNCHFDLKMDIKSIAKIVAMSQKEIKAIIAKEEKKRENGKAKQ